MKKNTIFLLFCIIITGCYKNTPKSDLEINDVVPQETNNTELTDIPDELKLPKVDVEKELAEYFYTEKPDYYVINNILQYPKVQSADKIDHKHISHEFDGALTDKNTFKFKYNDDEITVEIICEYLNTSVKHFLFYFDTHIEATKGYYEYGDAIDALKNLNFETNSKEVKIKSSLNEDKKTGYIFLDRISKTYESAHDIYGSFYIIISSDGDIENLKDYFDKVKNEICYW